MQNTFFKRFIGFCSALLILLLPACTLGQSASSQSENSLSTSALASLSSASSISSSSRVDPGFDVYNPDGYYNKSENLYVKIVGNSFVSPSFSNSAGWLKKITQANGISIDVDVLSIGNGRISDQINAAFGVNGYMSQAEKPDVLYVQDFYDGVDYANFADFLKQLYAKSPTTEAKIYPGENETDDGVYASQSYGVDLVPWKPLIVQLKRTYRFASSNLNAFDGWHPNSLSGFAGAILIYADLYGELPTTESLKTLAKAELLSYLPGETEEAKMQSVDKIITAVKTLIEQ